MQKPVYTTGDVALICHVAPRTVTKWIDSGRLKGYKLPGSDARRIPHDNLIEFLLYHGMPNPFGVTNEANASPEQGVETLHSGA